MITVAWNNILANMNMEEPYIKDREMDETSIPFALEVEIPVISPFEKQQQQQPIQYPQSSYYQQQPKQRNNNYSINKQPIFKACGKQSISSLSAATSSPYQRPKNNSRPLPPPPYSREKVKYFQQGQQQYLPKMSAITNKKAKKTQRESPYIKLLPKKVKQESPCEVPLLQRALYGQQVDLYKEKPFSSYSDYLKALEMSKDLTIEKNCNVDEVNNQTQSSSNSSSSSTMTSKFSDLENMNRTNLDNIKLNSVSNSSHGITKSSKKEKWAKFFLGKPKRKYNRKKQNRKSLFCINGETPEENLAYVIVKIEFQRGGIFFNRRSEVYSLIQKQYKRAITNKNTIDGLQDADDEDGGSNYSNNNNNKTTKTVLRMRFPSEDPTQRTKEHEYMDLLSLPDFQEFETNPQLWACIDELFGATDNNNNNNLPSSNF